MVWDMGMNSSVCIVSPRSTCSGWIHLFPVPSFSHEPYTCFRINQFLLTVSGWWYWWNTEYLLHLDILKVQALPLRPGNTDSKPKFWHILCHFNSSSDLLHNANKIITFLCFLWHRNCFESFRSWYILAYNNIFFVKIYSANVLLGAKLSSPEMNINCLTYAKKKKKKFMQKNKSEALFCHRFFSPLISCLLVKYLVISALYILYHNYTWSFL